MTAGGVGVLDKVMHILNTLEHGPTSLAELTAQVPMPRATTQRLAKALEDHQLVARDRMGQLRLGPRWEQLAHAGTDPLAFAARPVLVGLARRLRMDVTLHRLQEQLQVCVAAALGTAGTGVAPRPARPSGTDVGAAESPHSGATAQVLLAWAPEDVLHPAVRAADFTAPMLATVRRRGWASTTDAADFAHVAAPVRSDVQGAVIAALTLSAPVARLSDHPGQRLGPLAVAAANHIAERYHE